MGLKAFLISLDNESASYVVNTVQPTPVTGRVVIVMDEAKEVESVMLVYKGNAKVRWTERRSKNRTVTYSSLESFFETAIYLAGRSMGEKFTLESGEHSYPFSVLLPPNIPSSCKEKFGRIKYKLEAVVERSWKTNHRTKRDLNVVAPSYLHNSPGIMVPYLETVDKSFGFFGMCSGLLTMTLSIPSRGIVVGTPFPVTVQIENNSNVVTKQVIGKIEKYITYKMAPPKTRTKVTRHTMCRFTFDLEGVRRSSKTTTAILPQLPETPVNVYACHIIDILYVLSIKAVTAGMHTNVSIKKPVKFGSLPVVPSDFDTSYPTANYGFEPDFDLPPSYEKIVN